MIFGITLGTQACGTLRKTISVSLECAITCYAPGSKSNFSGRLCHGSAHTFSIPPIMSCGPFCHHTQGLMRVPSCDPPMAQSPPSQPPPHHGPWDPQPAQGSRSPFRGAVAACPSPTGCPLAGGPALAAAARSLPLCYKRAEPGHRPRPPLSLPWGPRVAACCSPWPCSCPGMLHPGR